MLWGHLLGLLSCLKFNPKFSTCDVAGSLTEAGEIRHGDKDKTTSLHHTWKREGSCLVLDESRISDGQKAALQTLTESFLLPNTHSRQWHTRARMNSAAKDPAVCSDSIRHFGLLLNCTMNTQSCCTKAHKLWGYSCACVELLMLQEEQALGSGLL